MPWVLLAGLGWGKTQGCSQHCLCPGILALSGARGDLVGLGTPIPSPGVSVQRRRSILPPCISFAELRRFHLCLLRRGNDRQDDRAGDFWEEMLLGRHVEPPGFLHRHRRVSPVRWVSLSLRLSVVIHGTAWQASDLGERLVCSGEGSGLAGHWCCWRCPSWLCSRNHRLDRIGPSGPRRSSRES